ncbi:MAG: sugar phosphate isomerase/epimerase family protein [Chloroflexota bacterium]
MPGNQVAAHNKPFCSYATLENEHPFSGYYVSLVTPQELNAFATQYDIGITLDTNHYAYMGVDIVAAARISRENVRTIHLSDYLANQTNVFIGEGELDFVSFFAALDLTRIRATTAECSFFSPFQPNLEMDHDKMIARMIELRETCEELIHRVTGA